MILIRQFISHRVALIALILTLSVHYRIMTYPDLGLLGTEARSASYDSLGDSLLHGRADARGAEMESLNIGKNTYMYFGPLPAFPRIILNTIWPNRWGQWARLTCLFASTLSLLACWAMTHFALKANLRWSSWARACLTGLAILYIGLGSPLLFLMHSGWLYNEAIVWGLAASMWGIFGALAILHNWFSTTRAFLILSTAAGAALLARVTFGVPLYLMLAILLVREFWSIRKDRVFMQKFQNVRPLVLSVSPAVAAVGMQLWYNYARFSSIMIFHDYRYSFIKPEKIGGCFNLRRIPVLFLNYLGFDPSSIIDRFPFVRMTTCGYRGATFFWLDWKELNISLLIVSPWLLLAGVWGAYRMVREKQWWSLACLIGLSSQLFAILSYYFCTQRYATEFIPWCMFGAISSFISMRPWPWFGWIVAIITLAASAITTISSTFHWMSNFPL